MIEEKRLRGLVRRVLLAERALLTESLKAKAEALTAALNDITGDARSGVGIGPGDPRGAHFRIRTDKTSTRQSAEVERLAQQIVDRVFGFEESTAATVGHVNSRGKIMCTGMGQPWQTGPSAI